MSWWAPTPALRTGRACHSDPRVLAFPWAHGTASELALPPPDCVNRAHEPGAHAHPPRGGCHDSPRLSPSVAQASDQVTFRSSLFGTEKFGGKRTPQTFGKTPPRSPTHEGVSVVTAAVERFLLVQKTSRFGGEVHLIPFARLV